MKEKEPTLRDVIQTIDELAITTAKGFRDVEKRFSEHDKRFDQINKKIEDEMRSVKAEISLGLREVKEEINQLEKRIDSNRAGAVKDINELVEKVEVCELDITKLKQKIAKLKLANS